jgi:hypothetical protein
MPKHPPTGNVSAMWERHWGFLSITGTAVVTIASSLLLFRLTAFLYINAAYGHAAWENGLRVVDNKGHLSDGGELSRTGDVIVYSGSYLLSVPFFLGSAVGLPYLRMRLRGERLTEQLARWKHEDEQRRQS